MKYSGVPYGGETKRKKVHCLSYVNGCQTIAFCAKLDSVFSGRKILQKEIRQLGKQTFFSACLPILVTSTDNLPNFFSLVIKHKRRSSDDRSLCPNCLKTGRFSKIFLMVYHSNYKN